MVFDAGAAAVIALQGVDRSGLVGEDRLDPRRRPPQLLGVRRGALDRRTAPPRDRVRLGPQDLQGPRYPSPDGPALVALGAGRRLRSGGNHTVTPEMVDLCWPAITAPCPSAWEGIWTVAIRAQATLRWPILVWHEARRSPATSASWARERVSTWGICGSGFGPEPADMLR